MHRIILQTWGLPGNLRPQCATAHRRPKNPAISPIFQALPRLRLKLVINTGYTVSQSNPPKSARKGAIPWPLVGVPRRALASPPDANRGIVIATSSNPRRRVEPLSRGALCFRCAFDWFSMITGNSTRCRGLERSTALDFHGFRLGSLRSPPEPMATVLRPYGRSSGPLGTRGSNESC